MFNPSRRSKKIGKTQGGRVTGGRATEKSSRLFSRDLWEKLSEAGGPVQIVRENPSKGFYHPCTAEECVELLDKLPAELVRPAKAIVLRRVSKHHFVSGVEAFRRRGCIVLNSFPVDRCMDWGTRAPTQRDRRHYDPWCSRWVKSKRGWALEWTEAEIRRYYLYHLILHELGHLNDNSHLFIKQREAFAENFALEWARKLGALAELA